MTTLAPVSVSPAWVKVSDGPFRGGIQNIGGHRVHGFVLPTASPAPTQTTHPKGFFVTDEMKPFRLAADESLWCKTDNNGTSLVVLG